MFPLGTVMIFDDHMNILSTGDVTQMMEDDSDESSDQSFTEEEPSPYMHSLIWSNNGEWDIDELQICEMGSWGPEGEYVCVGRCPLK